MSPAVYVVMRATSTHAVEGVSGVGHGVVDLEVVSPVHTSKTT
ncbi:hypothetical protein [Haladaptatus sp. CMAA 1911]